MDGLINFIERHAPNGKANGKEFVRFLKAARDSPEGALLGEDYDMAIGTLHDVEDMTYDDMLQLITILVPQLKSVLYPDTTNINADAPAGDGGQVFAGNIIDDADNEVPTQQQQHWQQRAVPQSTARGGVSLDSRSRRRTSPVKRGQASTAATEGRRLKGRNLAAATNEEYEALASGALPRLTNDIVDYAVQTGMGPTGPSLTHVAAAAAAAAAPGEYTAHNDLPLLDTEHGGFSTPHVSRRAIRERMKTIAPPTMPGIPNGIYDNSMPPSPDNSLPELLSPTHDLRSPTRYDGDDSQQKHIKELLAKKAELQRQVSEKARRLELLEGQYEKRTVSLERELDECKAELTMKKRDIERLRQSEKNFMESLQVAETEIEAIGVSLSNSSAQSAELRRQLDAKSEQATTASRRVLDQQAEINNLRTGLDANAQQQDRLAKEHRHLELQYQELEHELGAARELEAEAAETQKANLRLSNTIESLNREVAELRTQLQQAQLTSTDQESTGGQQRRAAHKYRSLQDELAHTNGQDLSGVDDTAGNADDGTESLARYRSVVPSAARSRPATKNAAAGTTSADAQELSDTAVRTWVSSALARCSSEDLVLLSEVWKRIEYCDTSTETQGSLRRDLIEVFMAPYKYGLKEAIRSRSSATLTRIVDNVAGEYTRMAADKAYQKGAPGLAQVMANGQYTTAAIVLYSVVIFCLGIITASYFNIAQPLATPVHGGVANGTVAAGDMNAMRQILVVDDTPVHTYYTPLRKRMPRSRFGEILFYWMETLLWDDADTPVPT
ncbi:hypothetical protein GGF46_004570 [Coemansia sp. RSA 552]|nr:hypothetical protein GGF46_004570 [Coemansia sp. RSA 552]